MTEAEWRVSTNPDSMLYYLQTSAPRRKLLLFAVACCRRVWHLMTDERGWRMVEVVERHIEGKASDDEWKVASAAAVQAWHDSHTLCCGFYDLPTEAIITEQFDAAHALRATMDAARSFDPGAINAIPGHWARALAHSVSRETARAVHADYLKGPERLVQCDLLREILGNVFRQPPALDPAWLTRNDGAVRKLAQAAYDERLLPAGTLDPSRLAVLADALEDAGCTDRAILDHLRGPGSHVRGCWPVDLLLAKS